MSRGTILADCAEERFERCLRLLEYTGLERIELEQINQWVTDGSDGSFELFQSFLTTKLGAAKPFDADSWDSGKAMSDLSRVTATLCREAHVLTDSGKNFKDAITENIYYRKRQSDAGNSLRRFSWQARLELPPAATFISWLKWLLPHRSYTKIVAPLVADEYYEYYDALKRHDEKLARWIRIRMYILLAWSTVMAFVSPIAKVFRTPN